MKKCVILFGLIICSIFCKEQENKNEILNGYYFDVTSSSIYNFKNKTITKYDILDSSSVNSEYRIEKNIIEIQNKKCPFEIKNDSLILFNFLEGIDKLILKKFSLNEFNLKNLDSTSWSRTIQRTSRETNTKYEEEQIIKFDLLNGLDAYYIKDKDTIFGEHYNFQGKDLISFYYSKWSL